MPRLLTLALLLWISPAAPACSIPIFRYALERWVPAKWDVFVYHRGPLTDAKREAVDKLRAAKNANITVIDVDLDTKPDTKHSALFERIAGSHELPLLAIRASDAEPKSQPAWTGAITQANIDALLDSPTRRQITRHLAQGHTGVLVLLESGDQAKDNAVAAMLDEQRPKMEATKLPEPSKEGTQPRSKLPLKVVFDVVRLSRSDKREAPFIRMLLAIDPELEKVKGPIVFPVFGRGRGLGGLHGDDLTPDELGHVARFLCGKCTCELKELNPGVDLLFSADWEGFVEGTAEPPSKKE
jgi:hypothetical protein